jgi:type VI secretion system protein ImpA
MPLRADLLNPIAGDNPSGANLRYDPVYDQIKEARRQDDTGPQGDWQRDRKVADYRQVVELASKVLAERSKDLQLAVWLTEAALHREKFPGLQQGLELVRALLEQFWDTLYPEIEDDDLEPRIVLLGWVGDRLVDAVNFTPITAGGLGLFHYKESRIVGSEEDAADSEAKQQSRQAAIKEGKTTLESFDGDAASTSTAQYEAWLAAMDGCLAAVSSLGSFCDEKFGNDAPSFVSLRTSIEEVRHTTNLILQKRPGRSVASEEAEEEQPELLQDPVADQAAAPARKRATAGIDPGFDPCDLDDVTARLNAVAKFLRAQDSSSPAPYLLLRGYRWGELRGYSDPPDPSLLIPPPTAVRQTIRRLAGESNWAELLEAAETAMSQPYARAWLDLQRHVVNAAEQSGYAHIAAAIRSEVRALLIDLPRLPDWEFSDETPVASAETHAWLKELASPAPPALPPAALVFDKAVDDPSTTPGAPAEPAPPDSFILAVEAARAGRASEAVQMLAAEIPRQQSGRARFQRKLQLAQICMMTSHETLAQPILEELALSIDQHHLDEWESPETIAHPLVMLYKLERDEAAKQKLYARISRLDPVQALECGR